MSFRYIGSKARIVSAITEIIGEPDGGRFIDAFSGTGAVGEAASAAGWPVHVNDHLISASLMSFARVTAEKDVQFKGTGGYLVAIQELNEAEPIGGFIWKEYSPASAMENGVARKYFTEENAKKIDAMRMKIREWYNEGRISLSEQNVLIADLMKAANQIANTAGTYGCFLSKWQRKALDPIVLQARDFVRAAPPATMSSVDVFDIKCQPEDTLYLDPPYTKRQYAAYYHILETIAIGDEPKVTGVCGIRPWQHKASDFCYKARAAKAIDSVVRSLPAGRVFLSYSTEGQVDLNTILSSLSAEWKVELRDIENIGRYRPNRAASLAGSKVGEVLFCIDKTAEQMRGVA